MQYLVDGYNLLFAAGFGRPEVAVAGELQRARRTMLNYLIKYLTPAEVQGATVVFDAKDAPRHLLAEFAHGGIQVAFARDHAEADDLIEELIRKASAPRKLTIVTDDLRLQQAGKRRRARIIKCHDWLDELERRHRSAAAESNAKHQDPAKERRKTREPMSAAEIEAWLHEFELPE